MVGKSRLVTVSPFDILIDTKEQKPWTFRGIPGNSGQGSILVKWYWESLGTGNGDYSIRGFIDSDGTPRVSIERKSLDDLYSTILSRRENFVRELTQLNDMEYSAIIVEAHLDQVMTHVPKYWKEMELTVDQQLGKQRSVMGSIYAWQYRYRNVRWWFIPRKYCSIVCYRLFSRFYEESTMGGK